MAAKVNPMKIWMVTKGLTPSKLADKAGITKPTCFKAISQKSKPSAKVLNKLIIALAETEEEKKMMINTFLEWRIAYDELKDVEAKRRESGALD